MPLFEVSKEDTTMSPFHRERDYVPPVLQESQILDHKFFLQWLHSLSDKFNQIIKRINRNRKDFDDWSRNFEIKFNNLQDRLVKDKPIVALGLCGLCKKPNQELIAHHISYYPELTILVCHSCHTMIHNGTHLYSPLRPPKEDVEKFYKRDFPNGIQKTE